MQQEMRYVYEIYRQKSFSKAAQALFITQPALSIAISKLEASLGMPLFDRSTRPISLTPAGASTSRPSRRRGRSSRTCATSSTTSARCARGPSPSAAATSSTPASCQRS